MPEILDIYICFMSAPKSDEIKQINDNQRLIEETGQAQCIEIPVDT